MFWREFPSEKPTPEVQTVFDCALAVIPHFILYGALIVRASVDDAAKVLELKKIEEINDPEKTI